MNTIAMPRYFARAPLVALALYFVAVCGCVVVAGIAVADILSRQTALAQTTDLLDQLRGRKGRTATTAGQAGREGTPFLEGPTLTVAGATLLQRLATAITTAGGTIQSSQVDLLGPQAKDGFVGLLVSCEMEQPALQTLLYDLEAGMPFLFVDQLNVQVPQTTAINDSGTGRIRVVLGVSGQWQGGK